jgi:hypothetical protein
MVAVSLKCDCFERRRVKENFTHSIGRDINSVWIVSPLRLVWVSSATLYPAGKSTRLNGEVQ